MPDHESFFARAAACAKRSTCRKDFCGCVIVKDGVVIGEGWNTPAGNREDQRMCDVVDYDWMKKKKADKTCCMHAEWRAIIDALRRHPDDLEGSVLYFTRVDGGGTLLKSGEPYCTVCSRFALDVGIAQFALWQETGIRRYDTGEYNQLSYAFHRAV
jgi:deoxycytidylate deaminase